MAEKFRSLMKTITSEISRHRLINNATLTLSNTTGKAQEKLNNIQNVVTSKYDVIAKQVNSDITLIQNLNTAQLEPSPLPKRVVKWWQWYQQLTGLDTVELAKHQVISAQDKLFKCQDERRLLNRQATVIADKLKEVYSELINTKRDDPKYVQLTMIENKNLQDQTKILAQLNLLEIEEKDHFTLLATAIKEYHDSQTMNAQKYKYLSILASASIAIVSLAGTMIYNNKRIMNVRNVITEAQQKNESVLTKSFNALQNDINTRFSDVLERLENNKKQNTVLTNQDEVLTELKTKSLPQSYVILGLCIVGIYVVKAVFG